MNLHEHSLQAYREERPKLSRRAEAIMAIFRSQPNRLFTDRDVLGTYCFQNHVTAADMNLVRPRLTELRDTGYIEEVGETVDRASRKKVRLLRLARHEPARQMELALA